MGKNILKRFWFKITTPPSVVKLHVIQVCSTGQWCSVSLPAGDRALFCVITCRRQSVAGLALPVAGGSVAMTAPVPVPAGQSVGGDGPGGWWVTLDGAGRPGLLGGGVGSSLSHLGPVSERRHDARWDWSWTHASWINHESTTHSPTHHDFTQRLHRWDLFGNKRNSNSVCFWFSFTDNRRGNLFNFQMFVKNWERHMQVGISGLASLAN